jgi:hypothetical protein
LHVLSLPPAFVLSQDQTLKLRRLDLASRSRMNRREHSHRIACAMQVTFSRNVIRQSLVRTINPLRDHGSADSAAHVSLSSIFSCQRSDITDAISWAMLLLALARQSVAHAALLDFTRANFSVASGAPPSLWGVYSRRPLSLSTPSQKFF